MNDFDYLKQIQNKLNDLQNKFNLLSQNIINVAQSTDMYFQRIAYAIDLQNKKIVDLIFQLDKKHRQDTSIDLQNLANQLHYTVTRTNTSNYDFKITNISNQIKNLTSQFQTSLLSIHNQVFINLMNLIQSKLNISKLTIEKTNNYLVKNNLLTNTKMWFCDGKNHDYTLPVFIRNFGHYGSDQKHDDPSLEEIKNSIDSMMSLINGGKIK